MDPEGLRRLVDLPAAGAELADDLGGDAEDRRDPFAGWSVFDAEAGGELVAELGRCEAAGGLRVGEEQAAVEGANVPLAVLSPVEDEQVVVELGVEGTAREVEELGANPLAGVGLLTADADLEGVSLEVAEAGSDGVVDRGDDVGADLVVAAGPDDRDLLRDREGHVVGDDGGRRAPCLGELSKGVAVEDEHPAIALGDGSGLDGGEGCGPSTRAPRDARAPAASGEIDLGAPGEPLEVGVLHPEDGCSVEGAVPLLTLVQRAEIGRPPPAARGRERRLEGGAGVGVEARDERCEVLGVDVARPPAEPLAGPDPGRVRVVRDGPFAGERGQLDGAARLPAALHEADALEVPGDAPADLGRRHGPGGVPNRCNAHDHWREMVAASAPRRGVMGAGGAPAPQVCRRHTCKCVSSPSMQSATLRIRKRRKEPWASAWSTEVVVGKSNRDKTVADEKQGQEIGRADEAGAVGRSRGACGAGGDRAGGGVDGPLGHGAGCGAARARVAPAAAAGCLGALGERPHRASAATPAGVGAPTRSSRPPSTVAARLVWASLSPPGWPGRELPVVERRGAIRERPLSRARRTLAGERSDAGGGPSVGSPAPRPRRAPSPRAIARRRLAPALAVVAAFGGVALGGSPATAAVPASRAAGALAAPASGLRVLEEPAAGVGPIYALLRSAKRTVDVEMYELEDPSAESILAADAERGVRVRVILDRAYVESENLAAFDYLEHHGVAVRWAPSRFDLDHEKAVMVDDRTALVMTLNLTARYYATTRDVAVVDTQPADVAAIETTFAGDWGGGGEASPPPGVDLLWSPGSEQALIALVASARREVLVENEEMDDPEVTAALVAAARRGVRVVVVMTRQSEWDGAFAELASAGAEVRTYADTTTGFYVHAKVVDVDPGTATARVFVGSENFSIASLVYNRELGILTSNPAVTVPLASMVLGDAAGGQAWR